MDKNFIETWAKKLNITPDVLDTQFNTAIQEMKSIFPNNTEEQIFEKAKLKIKTDYKLRFLSNAVTFAGIIIGNETPRDPMERIRNHQIELYEKAVELTKQDGDETHVKEIIDKKIVRVGENNNVIPLWPKLKSNGEPSKVAGNDMPKPEESMIKMVYAIGTPEGKEEPKGIFLELRGKAVLEKFSKGSLVSFRALNKTTEGSNAYELTTNQTEFIPSNNTFMTDGVKQFGVTGLIEKFFKDKIVSWQEINQWITEKRTNTQSEPVPDKYRNLMIIPESLCVYQNFNPDNKGRIKINICNASSDEIDDETVLCLADKSLVDSIDYAQNSKIVVIGRPWLPAPREDGDVTLIFMTSGTFAYSDWKVPMVDMTPVSEKDISPVKKVVQTSDEVVSETPEKIVDQEESKPTKENMENDPW